MPSCRPAVTRPTDMWCGFDTLAAQVGRYLAEDPLSGHLFVFHCRKGDRIKVLSWDTDGYALWCKRLERGTVKLPTVDPDHTPGRTGWRWRPTTSG
ncbi:MAG TPA: IS66 family insertion sequence element accessory protein TnpB [Gemmataceae bacterium]|nr:IS66 family insertion sequence element accessory protein TnpB [Gemmataceae bacterium]